MSDPTIDFHIQTHQTQFRIPIELIKKNFKSIQKLIEKQKKLTSDEVTKIKKNDKLSSSMKLELIQKLIKNFENFMKKLKLLIKKDEEYRSRLVARLNNIQELSKWCVNNHPIETKNGKDKSLNGKEPSEEKNGTEIDQSHDNDDKILDLHNPNLIKWYRDQTNLLIIDYLIKSNTSQTENVGIKLLNSLSTTNPNIIKLIDYDLFQEFNNVFISINYKHDLSLIISWFNENKNSLKKLNSNLEFEINYCKFLTLIEEGDINEAIKFSRDNLSHYGNKENYPKDDLKNHLNNLEKLKGLGGLLVFKSMDNINYSINNLNNQFNFDMTNTNGNGNEKSISISSFSNNMMTQSQHYKDYQNLLSNERWESLSLCFINNFIKLYGITKNYPLFIYLSAGLSSLKTKSCYYNTENTVFDDMSIIEFNHNDLDESAQQQNQQPHFVVENGNTHDISRLQTAFTMTSAAVAASAPSSSHTHPHQRQLDPKPTSSLTNFKFRGPNHYYKHLNKVNNCPICSPELFQLSRNLPYAQLITNIFNNPFKLPNGNIYPFDKLLFPNDKFLSERNELLRKGQIKDPLTKEIFFIDNCLRVFPA
ncbi:FYV10 [Candida pseudojiufengensis]|uniref:FYV10 n=1 Tax=Candida pseudojiufengensis TaxID=497109 RepID=UPI002224EBDD|nr:FYV10 [Candida pseudojiufengensis]KAI5961652.1 FYV10 [Candida pseudojiufengensis]